MSCERSLINEDRNSHSISIVSLNALLDYTRSTVQPDKTQLVKHQKDRIETIAADIADLQVPLDAVLLSEIQGKNGQKIAHSLGQAAGFWYEHNTNKRGNEHIGMFGGRVENATKLDLGDHRTVVITRVGSVAIAEVHLRHQFSGPERAREIAVLLEYLKNEEQVVIAGDFNALWFEKARRLVRSEGFESAFSVAGKQTPVTYPTEAYRDIMISKRLPAILRNGVNLDDMYVKGVGVSQVDRFETDSDHYGLYATIES